MEIHARRPRPVHNDQENVHAGKGKSNVPLPTKRQGLSVRGILGGLNSNVQTHGEVITGKVAVAAAEFEKKVTVNRALRSNYSHVQSKINTGLPAKNCAQLPAKPPLRREESTAGLAARAIANVNKTVLKENKAHEPKETSAKVSQAKKGCKDCKKTSKLPSTKENKGSNDFDKAIPKEPTESMRKLKLVENEKFISASPCTPQLPKDIENIDSNDSNPLLMTAYIKDIYRYLTELEQKYSIEPDYLKNQAVITERMRATLIDWLVEVHRQFSLILETFQLTVGIIDRYLQVAPNVQRSQLQLVGVTAMFIASKYEEIYAPEVGDFVYVTDNAYTKAEVLQCEREIMAKLGFCLARPIPLSFLRRLVKAANGTSKNHHLAKYFVDLSLVEYTMAHYRPSELAAAALCLSLHLLSGKRLEYVWTPTMKYYSGYTLLDIYPIIKKIAKIVVDVQASKFKAVYTKYSDASLARVSTLPQLKSDAILELSKCPSSPNY